MVEEARLTIKLEDEGVPQAPGRIPGQAPVEPGGIRPTAGVAIPPPSALPPKPPDPPKPPSLLPEPLSPSSKPPEPPDQREGFVRTFAQAGVSAIGPGVGAGVGAATQSGTAGALAGTAAGGAAQMLMGAGPIGLALGGAAAGAVILVEAFKGLTRWVNTVTDEMEEFSGPVAQAKAEVEIREIQLQMRRAQDLGPQMADFIEAQSKLNMIVEDIKTEILKIVVPILTDIFEWIKKGVEELAIISVKAIREIERLIDMLPMIAIDQAAAQAKMLAQLKWIREFFERKEDGDIISQEVRDFLNPELFDVDNFAKMVAPPQRPRGIGIIFPEGV